LNNLQLKVQSVSSLIGFGSSRAQHLFAVNFVLELSMSFILLVLAFVISAIAAIFISRMFLEILFSALIPAEVEVAEVHAVTAFQE
jgi:hypothetical protein